MRQRERGAGCVSSAGTCRCSFLAGWKPTLQKSPRRRRRIAGQQAAISATLERINQIEPQSQKAAKVIALMQAWLKDNSGYDEKAWPALKTALNQERARRGALRLFDE